MIVSTARRSGFTLLEVLLASAIAILLLGALYMAFDMLLRQADSGREVVSRGDLTRAIADRMSNDLSGCIGPMPPKSGGGIPEETTVAGTTGSTSGTSTGTTSTNSTGSTASSEATAVGTATGTTDLAESEGVAAADLPFQGGLFGSEKQVTLFVSRVPESLKNPETLTGGVVDMRPDLRRVTYYLGSGGGLCRQEKPWVTADGIRNSADPTGGEEQNDLIAEEVVDVSFSYFGSSGWTDVWTGSDAASDGGSVLGPPRAIQISLTIKVNETETKVVTHVIPIRAATGLATPPATEEEEVPDPTTTGS